MIKSLFDAVFDSSGNIKLCGREKCKALIIALHNDVPDVDFGDINAGFMNIAAVKDYAYLHGFLQH